MIYASYCGFCSERTTKAFCPDCGRPCDAGSLVMRAALHVARFETEADAECLGFLLDHALCIRRYPAAIEAHIARFKAALRRIHAVY